jgi:hypothetical protein
MGERSGASDANARRAAAQAALAPWLESLADLEQWFAAQARTIWPDAAAARSREVLTLLRQALTIMARGEAAVERPLAAHPSDNDSVRIDLLVAPLRSARRSRTPAQAHLRRNAILDLALWNALRRLGTSADAEAPTLARLHSWLVTHTPPAPGVSPAPTYAASADARRFFGDTVRGVVETLCRRADSGASAYAGVLPSQPFGPGLPAVVAWSHAWSVAVAAAYLDNLRRHARDDLQQALRDIWSGRLGAVRFRTGPGLTALPSHNGALHLDLWTCAVKAQTLAFDPAVWDAQAAGTPWHAVRVDMHDLSGCAAGSSARRVGAGFGVESLYRSVFVDRLQAVLAPAIDADGTLHGPNVPGSVRTLTIDMDVPRNGHLPNLRLLLRWRNPSGDPPRFIGQNNMTGSSHTPSDAVQRWLASHGDEGTAHALDGARVDWQSAAPGDCFADAGGEELVALGHGTLWASMEPAVQWLDAALMVCVEGQWYELPAVLHDQLQGNAADARTWWLLPAGVPLPAGLDASTLQRASGSAAAVQWAAHEEGVGAFVMVAIDVDAWRRTQPC